MAKCIAHQGFAGKYPGNTMLAFEKAIEIGCDGIEIDVHLTRDGVPVIIHDENTLRTTGVEGWIPMLTLEQIKKLDASAEYRGMYGNNPIPTLNEYFELMRGNDLLLNIELKNNNYEYPGLEKAVTDMVRDFGFQERTVLASFNNPSIIRCLELAPEIAGCFLTGDWFNKPVEYLREAGVTRIQRRMQTLTPQVINELREGGITIFAWTAVTRAEIHYLIDMGVDYIITDNPDLYFELIKDINADGRLSSEIKYKSIADIYLNN